MENNSKPASSNAQATVSKEDVIKRGEYLVTVIGCNDCHSPKRMGERGPEVIPELMLSGYPGDRPVQKASTDALKNGWGLLNYDITIILKS